MARKKSPELMAAEARMDDAYNMAYQNAAERAAQAPYRLTGKLTQEQRKTIARTAPAYMAARDAYIENLGADERDDASSGAAREDEVNASLGARILRGYDDTALYNVEIARSGLHWVQVELNEITEIIVGSDNRTDADSDSTQGDEAADPGKGPDFMARKRAASGARDGFAGSRRKDGLTRMSSFWHKVQERATDLSVKLANYRHVLGMAEATGSPMESKLLRPDIRLADDLKDCIFNVYNRAQRKLKSMDN